MSAFPSVQQIDPLSPSAVQNTMGIAANNNATAERGARQSMQTQALAQDSSEKAKYQQFLAGQQSQQLAAQAQEAELNRQAEERHAQRQEDLMREMKAIDIELDAARDEADSVTDEKTAAEMEAKRQALTRQKASLIHEISSRDLILKTTQSNLTSINKQVKEQIDNHVAEKTTLNTNLATSAAQSVSDFLLKMNADKNLLDSVARPKGLRGLVDSAIDVVSSPLKSLKNDPSALLGGAAGIAGAQAGAINSKMGEITDEQRRDVVLTNVLDEVGTKIASVVGGGDGSKKAISTLAGGITAMGNAATPESKQAAQQIIAQSVQALKEGSGGVLDDYTIHTIFNSVVDSLEKQAIEVGTKRGAANQSETNSRYEDVAKGFKDAANVLRANLDTITKPSSRAASNPAELQKSYTLAEGYFNVQNDPTNIDAHIKQVVDQLLTPNQKIKVDKALEGYRRAAAELPSLRENLDVLGDNLTTGAYMSEGARREAGAQKKRLATGARGVAAKLRGGMSKKKDEGEE